MSGRDVKPRSQRGVWRGAAGIAAAAALAGATVLVASAPASAGDQQIVSRYNNGALWASAWWKDGPNRLCLKTGNFHDQPDARNHRVQVVIRPRNAKPVFGVNAHRITIFTKDQQRCRTVRVRENWQYSMRLYDSDAAGHVYSSRTKNFLA